MQKAHQAGVIHIQRHCAPHVIILKLNQRDHHRARNHKHLVYTCYMSTLSILNIYKVGVALVFCYISVATANKNEACQENPIWQLVKIMQKFLKIGTLEKSSPTSLSSSSNSLQSKMLPHLKWSSRAKTPAKLN